jgi:hypothetical protein
LEQERRGVAVMVRKYITNTKEASVRKKKEWQGT